MEALCRGLEFANQGWVFNREGLWNLEYMKVNNKNRFCGLEEPMQKICKERRRDELKGRSRKFGRIQMFYALNSDQLEPFCSLRMTNIL